MRFAVFILADIFVTIGELLLSSAVLQEIFIVAAVLGPPNMCEQSLPILLVTFPVSLIEISLRRCPNAMTLFFAFFPLAFKFLPVCPCKFAIAFSLAVDEGAAINALFCLFYPSRFLILNEFTLEALFFSQKYPQP